MTTAMKSPRLNTHVRIRDGRTVDSARGRGGSLKGLRAVTISEPEVSGVNGEKTGPHLEERVAVAVYDDRAPMGIVTIPTRHLEHSSRIERTKAFIGGFGEGICRKLGIVRERTIYGRDGVRTETTYEDGSVALS